MARECGTLAPVGGHAVIKKTTIATSLHLPSWEGIASAPHRLCRKGWDLRAHFFYSFPDTVRLILLTQVARECGTLAPVGDNNAMNGCEKVKLVVAGENTTQRRLREKHRQGQKGVWPTNAGLMRAHAALGNYPKALQFAKAALPQAPDEQTKKFLEAAIKTLSEGKPL